MMQDTKKAVPVLHHQDGQVETGPVSQAGPHLHDNDTTAPPEGQGFRVADFLSPGAAHAIPLRNLVSITGLRERELRRWIEAERRAGSLILSDNRRGYWLADDAAEAQAFARSMLHRSREIARTARAVEAAAERMVDGNDL